MPAAEQAPVEAAGSPRNARGFAGFIVGVGASAGGLDALERLFTGLPADTGAAFVVIQHLSPDHKSMMDNLLARHTAMPVCVAEHEMPLAPDAIYLIPPGKTMRLAGDRLLLAPKPEHGLSLPIDIFFNSLAEHAAGRAIAIVLSGTGSDGSRGLPAVNAAGGFVFVQDPATAKFDGMPRSAIATGQVDVVAPADELCTRLLAHLRAPRPSGGLRLPVADGPPSRQEPLDGILERLLATSGIDFRQYKPTTVLRRIERRMQVLHAASLADYLDRLDESTTEPALLRRELLIPVTRFFRDAEAFDQLAESVIPPLLDPADGSEPIRVWVACCATGEEAYSLAMLFAEAFRRLGRSRPVKIFATDVEAQYLDHAAAGLYPGTVAAELSRERLQQHFIERGDRVAVRPEIRQMVIFARHNLIADPPFTRMDLVSCRNALIYLQPEAQQQAMQRLQYALVPGGHLFLGPSESLGPLQRNFAPLPGRHKIYRALKRERLGVSFDLGGRHRPTAALQPHARAGLRAAGSEGAPGPADLARWVGLGQQQLLQAYGPLTLLVGPGRELLHVWGDASGWLQFSPGEATLDVLRLLPRELAWAATLLLAAVGSEDCEQRSAPLALAAVRDGAPARVRLVARSLRLPEHAHHPTGSAKAAEEGLETVQGIGASTPAGAAGSTGTAGTAASGAAATLLSIEPLPEAAGGAALAEQVEAAALDRVQQQRIETLERELALSHDHLQATVEELETANEELQATNEELMAANEELQSTNEELHSVNEELYTVNAEYQEKVDILNSLNADLENVSKAAAIPTLFVDDTLHLTRFTPEAALLFKLRPGDRGRSIEDFAHTLEYPTLFADLRRTLATGVAHEQEVRSRDGQWWLARMQPYAGNPVARAAGRPVPKQGGGTGARAVLTFFNVSSVKDSQRLQQILDALSAHVAVLDTQGNITQVNAAWRRFAGDHGDPGLDGTGPGRNYLEVCARAALHDDDARRAYDGLAAVLAGRQAVFTLQYPCHTPQRAMWFLMHVAALPSVLPSLPPGAPPTAAPAAGSAAAPGAAQATPPAGRTQGSARPLFGAVVSHIDITPWAGATADRCQSPAAA
jgi:two-component system CheB/CheR fusion protein